MDQYVHNARVGKKERDFNEYKRMVAHQKLKPAELPPPQDLKDVKLIVSVRKRPLLTKEQDEIDCISVSNPKIRVNECGLKVDLTKIVTNHDFKFDYSFGDHDSTDTVYLQVIKPLIPLLNKKGTVTIFAYGQTGSGKTFTMEGIQKAAIRDMFALAKSEDKLNYYASYFEIYDGKVFDLLNKRQKLVLLEDGNNKIQVKGLSETETNSVDKILKVIEFGNKVRSTSPTVANDTSSRSHAICKIQIKKGKEIIGTLLLIDLAGSEKAQIGQANNRRRRLEGTEINKSLLALKECIRAIDMKGPHIPFRASKLTMVLRDSFIGSGKKNKIVMIACVTPAKASTSDSINTLLYADRLKENKSHDHSGINTPKTAPDSANSNKQPPKIELPAKLEIPESGEECDFKRLMTTLMMEDRVSFMILNAAEELKKAEEELMKAYSDFLKQNDRIKRQEEIIAEKLKDLEINDMDQCVVEMEKMMGLRAEAQKKLTQKITVYKKKLHEEEESSKDALKYKKD